MFNLSPMTIMARLVVLLTALPVHEAAHAWVAEKMGDRTARYRNRVTLNPFDHIDPIGAVMIVLFGIGFAKPVPVNYAAFRNTKQGIFWTSAAGPLSNVLLAWVSLVLCKLMMIIYALTDFRLAGGATDVFYIMMSTNLSLAVFNLLPIPPLDGYHAIEPFLPGEWAWKVHQYEQQLVWAVLLLIWMGAFDGILSAATGVLYFVVEAATSFIDVFAGWLL